jgi:hypothetical protein
MLARGDRVMQNAGKPEVGASFVGQLQTQSSRMGGLARPVLLLASCIWLGVTFPEHFSCTLVVFTAFALDAFVASTFRPVLWALIGSVVAYLAMTLAFYVRQFAFPYHVPHLRQPLLLGYFLLRFASSFAPLLILTRFFPIGRRRIAFVTLCTLSTGSVGYYCRGQSTDWRQTLWMEYSSVTWGCCIGAVVGTTIIGIYDTMNSPESPSAN